MSTVDEPRPLPILLWALILGGTGLATGFFGPLTFVPEANQGPLLGLIVTGPAGFVLGIVLGTLFRFLPVERAFNLKALCGGAMLVALVTLSFSMPEPRVVAYALDAELEGCTSPEASAPEAIQYWERRVAAAPWATPRGGWKESAPQMLRNSGGVVLHLRVRRTNPIREHRKPWNRGYIDAAGWRTEGESRAFYARYAGSACDAYGAPRTSVYYDTMQSSTDWPPREPGGFLDLITVRRVPQHLQPLVED
jgi:hypothetical protein